MSETGRETWDDVLDITTILVDRNDGISVRKPQLWNDMTRRPKPFVLDTLCQSPSRAAQAQRFQHSEAWSLSTQYTQRGREIKVISHQQEEELGLYGWSWAAADHFAVVFSRGWTRQQPVVSRRFRPNPSHFRHNFLKITYWAIAGCWSSSSCFFSVVQRSIAQLWKRLLVESFLLWAMLRHQVQ